MDKVRVFFLCKPDFTSALPGVWRKVYLISLLSYGVGALMALGVWFLGHHGYLEVDI